MSKPPHRTMFSAGNVTGLELFAKIRSKMRLSARPRRRFSIAKQHMSRATRFSFRCGTAEDAATLAALHTAVAGHLTCMHGRGPWSTKTSEKGVRYAMRTSQVFVAQEDGEIVATLRLATKKPWAIDTSYFAKCHRPLYLLAMAVTPAKQRQGLGRRCLEEVKRIARAWPADAIRLDAYDADTGAGRFYARCGCTEVGRVSYRNTPLIYYQLLLI
jgi:GNAT superfamily N-acetyltransferase